MGDHGSSSCAQRAYFRVLLFVGLILSETQLLVNLKSYTSVYTMPYFTLAYFVLTSLHLGFTFGGYGFWGRREKGAVLEWYEHLVLPLSVLLLSLLAKNSDLIQFKASCALLLALQSLFLTGKIIYFNSVTPELAQISTINKLVRVVKLNVIGLLPLVVQTQLVIVVVVALCQAISLCAFFLKFTYQKCIYEYVLLVGVFCGFISAVENVFETIFALPYLFIGELAALFFYLHQRNFLRSALEIKYTSSLGNTSEAKQDDEVLAGLLFVQECLFEGKRTIELSQTAKNQGAIQACTVLDRIRPAQYQLTIALDPVFQMRSGQSRREVSTGLFQAYCQRFHQTDSFSCFQFTVGSALELGGSFTSKALVLYYSFMERKRAKASIFETCKFNYLYQRVVKQVEAREADREDINFIQFSDNLRLLGSEIEQCLANELKLVEYLADRGRKTQMLTDDRIFVRSKLKKKIRVRLERCIAQGIYFCSNQFKFLFLLYHISIEKRYLSLKEQLKQHFLASQVQRLRYQGSQNSLIVLAGFNHGEIINSNEVFKSHFGLALSSFARSNISQFIPTQKQRSRHSALMVESVEFRRQRATAPHCSYQCRLAIEREFGSVKLKVVENFSIGVRIYYENSSSFNYICSLEPLREQQGQGQGQAQGEGEKETLILLRRDCQNFSSKGIQFSIVQQTAIDQLDQHLELTEIEFAYDNPEVLKVSGSQQRALDRKERAPRVERYLQEKTARIEKKLLEEGVEEFRYTWSNVAEVAVIGVFAVFIFIMLASIGREIQNLKESISELLVPVTTAELVHNRVLLQQQILSLQAQTPFFPDDICSKVQLFSITSYIINILYRDLQNNTDSFISALSALHNFGQLGQNLYQRQFQTMPFLLNPPSIVSYQKYIQLTKSQTFYWLSTLHNSSLNVGFYSGIYPGIMQTSTIDGGKTLTTLLQNSQQAYINDVSNEMNKLRAIALVLVGVLGALAIGLRVRDNRALIDYLRIVECIPPEQLTDRIRELKSALGQLHQVRANRIDSIEFDRTYLVQIRSDKREPEVMPVQEFAQWHLRSKAEYELEDSDGSYCDEDKQFLQRHGVSESVLTRSKLLRLLVYKKWYLLLAAGLIICVMALTDSAVNMQRTRMNSLALCSAASLELSKIQQKFINLAAYNWLKVLSLQQSFDMSAAKLMYNQAINSLLASTYLSKVTAAYSKDISDQVLYGDVCGFFSSPQACQFYRNNLFSSGLSMLIPFVVKEMVQIDQISSNYTYYLLNMCDKTWLLFDGIVPLTTNISSYGFNAMITQTEKGFTARYLQMAAALLSLLLISIIFQYRRYHRERVVKEEVFSLDTVENLYSVAQFKPYFNKIYYS